MRKGGSKKEMRKKDNKKKGKVQEKKTWKGWEGKRKRRLKEEEKARGKNIALLNWVSSVTFPLCI